MPLSEILDLSQPQKVHDGTPAPNTCTYTIKIMHFPLQGRAQLYTLFLSALLTTVYMTLDIALYINVYSWCTSDILTGLKIKVFTMSFETYFRNQKILSQPNFNSCWIHLNECLHQVGYLFKGWMTTTQYSINLITMCGQYSEVEVENWAILKT